MLGEGRDGRYDDARRVALELTEHLDGAVPAHLLEVAMRLVVPDDDLMDQEYPLEHLSGGQEAVVALVHAVRVAAADGALDDVLFAAEAAVNAADAEAIVLMPDASDDELARSPPLREERERQWNTVLDIESRGVDQVATDLRTRIRSMLPTAAVAATGTARS